MSGRTLMACGLLVVGALVLIFRNASAPLAPQSHEAMAADAAPAKPAGNSAEDDSFFDPPPAKPAAQASKPPEDKPAQAAPPVAKPAAGKPRAEQAKAGTGAGGRPLRGGVEAILRALEEPTSLELKRVPLNEAIELLQDRQRIPIVLDKMELESMGIGSDTLVTCNARNVPLSSALTILLDRVGFEPTIWCGELLITSRARAESAEMLITRIYDVSDLLRETPDYKDVRSLLPGTDAGRIGTAPPASPGSHPAPVGLASIRSGMGDRAMFGKGPADDVIDLLTTSIAPNTWDANGGLGTVHPLDRALIISQTLKIHLRVSALLADLRAKRQAVPTLIVEIQWLWLDNEQCEELLARPPVGKGPAAGRTPLALDAAILDRLARKAPGFRGRIACANGQWVHLASGDRRAIVPSKVPAVDGGVAYMPLIDAPNAGVLVELRPTVEPGAESAVLDVESCVTRWGRPRPTAHEAEGPAKEGGPRETGAEAAGSASCPVERPSIPAQEFATTLRVPLGRPVLVGGMTFAPAGPAGLEDAGKNPLQLYLIATTRIAAEPAGKPAR